MSNCAVLIGDNCVTLKPSGSSNSYVVGLLGTDLDASGSVIVLYLDSLIHTEKLNFIGWNAVGAISTILTRVTGTNDVN
ncbi:MAG: hypothetical protein QM504_06640 [Pseudomonadota bacterium]